MIYPAVTKSLRIWGKFKQRKMVIINQADFVVMLEEDVV